jgi:hypothetical protein
MPSFGEQNQGPFNAFFPKGENSAFGVHQIRFIGSGVPGLQSPARQGGISGVSTGLILATGINSGGVPGVTATLLATGIYDIRFPPTKSVDINAQVYGSSGYRFVAAVNNLNGVSGSAQIEVTRLVPTLGAATPSGQGYLPTGSVLALSFFAAPNSDGLVGY